MRLNISDGKSVELQEYLKRNALKYQRLKWN